MLGHASGMIGFPLRLLARENYDRVVRHKGVRQVALVTGEEKIVPPGARYFLCTVESMPLDRPVAFLAVDEIQLCADPERGHVFTDRLLHARGAEETMFLGAETIRPLLRRLVPAAEIVTRPRFSTLRHAGPRKLTRLPPRCAVVAFSAAEVYQLAEVVRRQRGGTAVVLGALSPRTRNAQVGMFEAGEVDYLVATDAIGMGLNLDLDHVAFARLTKFDGIGTRRLSAPEVAQIAGRAGRHMSDGTFGTTNGVGPLPEALVEAVENHRFEALRHVQWRTRDLDFRSPRALLRSLDRPPPRPELVRARDAEDVAALAALAGDAEIAALACHPEAVRLLWEVCRIPDFQKTLSDQHVHLLGRVYRFLRAPAGRLPEDWVARQIARIERTDGDIDALAARIAQVRTWTYITHRGDWLAGAAHWQERTRAIEDRLSDALHERLTQRFVDRRAALLVRRLRTGDALLAALKPDGAVLVEGQYVGRLEGFRFRVDTAVAGEEAKPLLSAARRALIREIPARIRQLEQDSDAAFVLCADGRIAWRGVAVARLAPGVDALHPQIDPLPSEFLDARARARVHRCLSGWLERHIAARLGPLLRLAAAVGRLSGPARGLAYQLGETLGAASRAAVAAQVRALSRSDRKALAGLGLRLGRESVYLRGALEARSAALRALLWAVHAGVSLPVPTVEEVRAPSFPVGEDMPEGLCLALGYRRFSPPAGTGAAALAVRVDVLERLAYAAHKLAARGPFAATARLRRLAGCDAGALAVVLQGLRYRMLRTEAGVRFVPRRRAASAGKTEGPPVAKRRRRRAGRTGDPDSPFARLRELEVGR
ncbi:MAG: disulfide oxidoreductase [Alphaproteobacteria bacterium]|nr:MAG: disulfide oxidoreductase [Alphaproteobacteria bacterium]